MMWRESAATSAVSCGLLCALIAALGAAGCSSGPEAPVAPPAPEVSLESFEGPARAQVAAAVNRLRAQPSSAAANGELAMLLQAYSQLETAEILYRRAQTYEPSALRWPYYLGVVQATRGEQQAAAESFTAALDVDPEFFPARRRLAASQLELNQLGASRENYAAVLPSRPDDPQALFGLGRLAALSGDANEAVELLERAVEIAPSYAAAHYELALAYRDSGREADSRRHLAIYERDKLAAPPADDPLMAQVSSLRQDPTERIARAAALAQDGRIEPAVAELKQALADDPTLVQAHINLLILYGRLGRTAEAERHYRTALELNSERAELHYNYGVLMAGRNKLDEAEAAFRKALDGNPNHAASLHNLGQIEEARQRFSAAESMYRRAIAARPDYRLAHFHLGRLLLNKGKTADAIASLRKTLEPQDEQTPEFLYGLAGAYARSGDRARALRYGEQARALALEFQQADLAKAIERDLARLR